MMKITFQIPEGLSKEKMKLVAVNGTMTLKYYFSYDSPDMALKFLEYDSGSKTWRTIEFTDKPVKDPYAKDDCKGCGCKD